MPIPLSFAQQGLWLAQLLRPHDPANHMVKAFRLRGDLDVPSFRRALDALVARHEILRTTYDLDDDGPVQRVGAAHPMLVEELSSASTGNPFAEFAQRPFDLANGPVARAALVPIGEREHLFALCVHHIAADGLSIGILCRELAALYAAYRMGATPNLRPSPRQFRDCALAQRALYTGDHLNRLVAFWRRILADPPEPLFTSAAPPAGRLAGLCTAAVAGADLAALRSCASRGGATLQMMILAAYARGLAAAYGRDEVVIGIPVAQRNDPEDDDVVGCLVDMVLVRVRAGGVAFDDLLDQVRDRCLDAYEYHVPLEVLLEHLATSRRRQLGVPFDAVFGFLHRRNDRLALADLEVDPSPAELSTVQLPLDLEGVLDDDRLILTLRHDISLVDEMAATRLLTLVLDQLFAAPRLRR